MMIPLHPLALQTARNSEQLVHQACCETTVAILVRMEPVIASGKIHLLLFVNREKSA